MNEVKLKRVLKQLTTLANLQDKKNKNIVKRLELLNFQIKALTTEINYLINENLTKSARIT